MQTKLKLVMHGYGEAKMSSILYFKFLIRIPNITASTACSTSTSSRTFKLLESSVHYYKQIASILHLQTSKDTLSHNPKEKVFHLREQPLVLFPLLQ